MNEIYEVLVAAFPVLKGKALNETMPLGAIAGWDSMNSVSLAIELETRFKVVLLDRNVVLTGDHTLADVLRLLREAGATI